MTLNWIPVCFIFLSGQLHLCPIEGLYNAWHVDLTVYFFTLEFILVLLTTPVDHNSQNILFVHYTTTD